LVDGNSVVGGLIGRDDDGTINHAYWNTATSGLADGVGSGSSAGTTGLTTEQMQQQASFGGFDFTDSNTGWFIYEGHTAPLLNAFLTPLTITADDLTQTYTGTGFVLGLKNAVYSISDVDASRLLGMPYGHAVNVGSYAPQLWSHQQGYRITLVGGTLAITPKTLTITGVTAHNKTYDGTTSAILAAAGSLSGLVNGETLTLDTDSLVAVFDDKNAGTGKTVTVTGYAIGNGTGLASNYVLALAPVTTTADITPKTVSVAGATVHDKVYDGTTAATIASAGALTGLVGSETLTLNTANLNAAFDDKNAGTGKTVTVEGYALADGGHGGRASNYVLALAPVTTTADITPAALTVTANDLVKNFDGLPHRGGNGVTYTGFVPGEDASVLNGLLTYSGTSQGAVENGEYIITPGGLSSGNYIIGFVDGTLTIQAVPAPPAQPADTANQIDPVVASLLHQVCDALTGQCRGMPTASPASEQLMGDEAHRAPLTEQMIDAMNPARCLQGGKLLSSEDCG